MSLAGLASRNITRSPLRSVLTVAAVAVAVVTFILLRTVVWAFNVAAEQAVPDRVVTRHKVTFVMPVPHRYVDDIRQVPGVKTATFATWWGGKEPNHPNEFFATLAVDPATYFQVYEEMIVPADQLESWKEDRQGLVVGDLLAQKFGWKVGDTVTLESTIWEGSPTFHVRGIYTATRKTVDRQTVLFHWVYFNEMMPQGSRENIGWTIARTDGTPTEVGRRIDALFDERDVQTVSQDEATFQRSFLAGFAAILFAIDTVSLVILGIMMMILGNTVAMGVRERTSEYGVLRAIGFLPWHLVVLVVVEAGTLGLLGGTLGLLLSYPVVELGIGRFLEENLSGFFPYFRVSPQNAAAALVMAFALSALASAIPALQVSRLKVVEALRRVG